MDTITSTADSKDCPGVCVHALATIICYDVLEDVACPSPSMKCCVEPPAPNTTDKIETTINNNTTMKVKITTTTTEAVTSLTTITSTTIKPSTTTSDQASFVLHNLIIHIIKSALNQ